MIESQEITQLLQRASGGDPAARNALFDSVYQQLRSIARAQRRNWNGNDTLNTTALIHEAYFKLAGSRLADYQGRGGNNDFDAVMQRSKLKGHPRVLLFNRGL